MIDTLGRSTCCVSQTLLYIFYKRDKEYFLISSVCQECALVFSKAYNNFYKKVKGENKIEVLQEVSADKSIFSNKQLKVFNLFQSKSTHLSTQLTGKFVRCRLQRVKTTYVERLYTLYPLYK